MPGFGCLRAEGENRPSRPGHLVCFAQNRRDEVRDLVEHSGALAANAGMKQDVGKPLLPDLMTLLRRYEG